MQKPRGGRLRGAPNILNLNIHNYEQRQCDQLMNGDKWDLCVGGDPLTSLRTTGSLCVPERGKEKTSGWIDMGQARRGQRSWADLGFLLLCEVIFDVEGLPDLLGGLSFDHVGHRLTGDVQQAFNVEVIGRLKEKAKEAVLKLLPEHYEFAGYVRLGFRLLEVNSSASVCCLISLVFWSPLRCLFTRRNHVKAKCARL